MPSIPMSAVAFEEIGMVIMGRRRRSGKTFLRRFTAWFGIEPFLCAIVWQELQDSGWAGYASCAHPEHLLWALLFLCCYQTEEVHASLVGADEKTFRKWAWFFAEGIAGLDAKFVSRYLVLSKSAPYCFLTSFNCSLLPQIRFENRFRGDTFQKCLVTVDGVDFQIEEPTPFSTAWYSHKFHGPGLRYELAVSISTGDIVAFNGPFPCGAFPDLKIFRSRLKQELGQGEKVVADRGYKGDTKTCTPDN
jgi:hypothetical protein